VTVSDPGLYVAIVKSSMADIQARHVRRSTGVTQPDGSQKAIESISSRNRCAAPAKAITTGDLKPNTKMTNATSSRPCGVRRADPVVKYKDGEKK